MPAAMKPMLLARLGRRLLRARRDACAGVAGVPEGKERMRGLAQQDTRKQRSSTLIDLYGCTTAVLGLQCCLLHCCTAESTLPKL